LQSCGLRVAFLVDGYFAYIQKFMLAYTYIEKGKFALVEKPKPTLIEPTDAIVRVTMGSICTSDLHIKHGSVPRAVKRKIAKVAKLRVAGCNRS
jgi:threonine dehydrogenase-like Zn-dependent dehydrogenase